jgi:hypothetical protein
MGCGGAGGEAATAADCGWEIGRRMTPGMGGHREGTQWLLLRGPG